jgi:PBP1b-binding outer membrane lipoprotein LpoB
MSRKLSLILFILVLFVACQHQPSQGVNDRMNQIVDPITKSWFLVEDALDTVHKSGSIPDAQWREIVTTRNLISLKMRSLWKMESDVTSGLATIDQLQSLATEISADLKPLQAAAGVTQ